MTKTTNISHVLNSNSYKQFLAMAQRERNFNRYSNNKKTRVNPLKRRATTNLHSVQRTPPAKSPGQFNMTKVKNTPGGSRVLRSKRGLNYRLPMSGSPLPFEKTHKRLKADERTYSPQSPFNLVGNNHPERKQLMNIFKNMQVNEYKKGGLVRKTGLALVHKGELVIPVNKVAHVRRALAMYKRRTSKK